MKMFITISFFFMYMLNSINAQQCSPYYCPRGVNASVFSTDISIMYPFRLKDQRYTSCGVPGFDLYCHKTYGTLIGLPHNVLLRVDSIDYYSQIITLSDPFNCLPQKYMSLDLMSTPFRAPNTLKFWLYNCSGGSYPYLYDQIDCMSGSEYTIISSRDDEGDFVGSQCSFSRTLSVPHFFSSNSWVYLSGVSRIRLFWTGFPTPPPPRNDSNSTKATRIGISLGIGGVAITILIVLCYCRKCKRRNAQASLTTTTTNTTVDMTTRSQSAQPSATSVVAIVVEGLDQATIDLYPLVILSKSSGLLKSDDNTCSICLSEYEPREAVRMLPECLHRFHKECIDPWLRSKGHCPICRTCLTSSIRQNL